MSSVETRKVVKLLEFAILVILVRFHYVFVDQETPQLGNKYLALNTPENQTYLEWAGINFIIYYHWHSDHLGSLSNRRI